MRTAANLERRAQAAAALASASGNTPSPSSGASVSPSASSSSFLGLGAALGSGGVASNHDEGERHLLEYLEAEARDLSPDAFGRLMNEAYNRVAALLSRG